jgi:hypothetical protein
VEQWFDSVSFGPKGSAKFILIKETMLVSKRKKSLLHNPQKELPLI